MFLIYLVEALQQALNEFYPSKISLLSCQLDKVFHPDAAYMSFYLQYIKFSEVQTSTGQDRERSGLWLGIAGLGGLPRHTERGTGYVVLDKINKPYVYFMVKGTQTKEKVCGREAEQG